ncbi:MFS transporter [Leucobacter coleopterorum]|uniref:MFS transporter n=1 Tax=Leucobacter coleopterorum TaxID=2714933 RepID=UPI001FCC159D|nr:MFS transporter [Leucobacter coleopterorum]
MNAVGAAIAGMPLARLAAKSGRRIALATGNLTAVGGAALVIVAAATHIVPLLFVGLAVLGIAVAVQLQSRFAAADLALSERRGRDLSLVVWSITIGAVTGPNLIGPGEYLGIALGLPGLAGIFIFTIAAQLAAACVVWFGLRPDPLLESRRLATAVEKKGGSAAPTEASAEVQSSPTQQYLAIAVIALAHAVMVGLMAMTPLHLTHHGGSIELVGFTISIHIAGMYALSPVFGFLTGRFGAIPVVFVGFGVLGLAAIGTFSGVRVWRLFRRRLCCLVSGGAWLRLQARLF